MLKSMKVLPDVSIAEASFANCFSDFKGKGKATNDGEDNHVSKKCS